MMGAARSGGAPERGAFPKGGSVAGGGLQDGGAQANADAWIGGVRPDRQLPAAGVACGRCADVPNCGGIRKERTGSAAGPALW